MRLGKLLVSGTATLAVLGGCLSTARAVEETAPAPEISAQVGVAPAAADDIPLPEELDETSTELDDEISNPVPEELEGEEPAPFSEMPGQDERLSDEFEAPDPKEDAAEAETACRVRLAAALAAGRGDPVSCVTLSASAPASELRAAVDAWPIPNWCDDPDNKWYVTRFKACGIFPYRLTVRNPRTGAVVGEMTYLVVAYAYSKRDIKTWAYQVEMASLEVV